MKPKKENPILSKSTSNKTPEEKVEKLKEAIMEIGFKIEETAEGIRIFEAE